MMNKHHVQKNDHFTLFCFLMKFSILPIYQHQQQSSFQQLLNLNNNINNNLHHCDNNININSNLNPQKAKTQKTQNNKNPILTVTTSTAIFLTMTTQSLLHQLIPKTIKTLLKKPNHINREQSPSSISLSVILPS